MVITRLMGGLGNQMFQYAAARRLALVRRVPLKLDVTWFERSPDRAYALSAFNIDAALATPAEVAEIRGPDAGAARLAFRLRRLSRVGYRWHAIHERFLSPVDARVLAAGDWTYLEGYWQSEKYFGDVADAIRREFAITWEPDARGRALLEQMGMSESVSVHVRRGDYAASVERNVCTPAYYATCVARVAERVAAPHLFLFSDDPGWVAANLRFDYPTTIVSETPARSDHADMRLMSACRHHILANSSFSWWGAWLNPRADKLVYAPRRWMNDRRVDDRDVVPEGWTRV
jgi:hypothetical protein